MSSIPLECAGCGANLERSGEFLQCPYCQKIHTLGGEPIPEPAQAPKSPQKPSSSQIRVSKTLNQLFSLIYIFVSGILLLSHPANFLMYLSLATIVFLITTAATSTSYKDGGELPDLTGIAMILSLGLSPWICYKIVMLDLAMTGAELLTWSGFSVAFLPLFVSLGVGILIFVISLGIGWAIEEALF